VFTASRPPVRSWAATIASAVAHGVAVVVLVSLARAASLTPLPRVNRPVTFFSIRIAPDPALIVPVEPVHLPPLVRDEPKTEELAPLEVTPPPAPPKPPEVARVEPKPAPEPKRESPVVVERPKPAVTLGAFPSGASAAHSFEPPKPVEHAGFDAPAAQAPEIKLMATKVGTFDQQPSATPKPGSDRANIVADAGFGTAATARASQQPRRVADAGFGAAAAAQKNEPQRTVQATDFDARPAPTVARAPRELRIEIPLEILSKPTPEYTEEARNLRIEGDVLLEVEFCASGQVKVVRVVRGLGHGLDEAATRAAQSMRFKPAQSGGRAIDFRTTVHILFRLA
jgi:TonB family protein